MNTCVTCRWFLKNPKSLKNEGECRLLPPTVLAVQVKTAVGSAINIMSNFPSVSGTNCFCGQHRPVEEWEKPEVAESSGGE